MNTQIQTDRYGFPVRRTEDRVWIGQSPTAKAWEDHHRNVSVVNDWRHR